MNLVREEGRQSPTECLALVTARQVNVASCEDAQASQGLTAAGREAGVGKQGQPGGSQLDAEEDEATNETRFQEEQPSGR